jgi:hypothetical protein
MNNLNLNSSKFKKFQIWTIFEQEKGNKYVLKKDTAVRKEKKPQ